MYSNTHARVPSPRHAFFAALTAAIAMTAGTAAQAALPTYDTLLDTSYSQYNAPAGWQNNVHGTMLSAVEVTGESASRILASFSDASGTQRNLSVWRIKYTTTGADANRQASTPGAPLLATGLVIVPLDKASPKASRPIILFAPKTQGLGSNCAPSKALELGKEEASEVKRMVAALDKGYAVAVTDYDGYTNNSASHQYLVGHALGHAVLDMGLAIKKAMPTFVASAKPLKMAADSMMAIWGYSEGGTAAAWAGQLLATYAPTLQSSIKGVATGGPVADFKLTAKTLDSNAASGLLLAAVWGYHVAYPKPFSQGGLYFDINDTFKQDLLGNFFTFKYQLTPPSTDTAGAILHRDECVTQLALDYPLKTIRLRNAGGYVITDFTTGAWLNWEPVLQANIVGNIQIPVPTYLYYGTISTAANPTGVIKEGDLILPADNFNGVVERMCAAKTKLLRTVIFSNTYLAVNHSTASDKAFDLVTTWLAARFNGDAVAAVSTSEPNEARDTVVTNSCNL
jgi:hypothetical protein